MTRDQQKRLNAMCGDLERQIRLDPDGGYVNRALSPNGLQIDKDSWRWIFCGTYKGWKSLPAIDGAGFVMLGASSRALTVPEAGEVMEMMAAFGATRDVAWSDPAEIAAQEAYEAQGRG